MLKKPKVFVIILNWNQWELTLECLESVRELRTMNYELRVVVVDNGSTDNSKSKIQKAKSQFKMNNPLRGKNLELLENKENLGFVGGNNVGIKYALKNNADYVMVLNNDTTVHSASMNQFIEVVKDNPEVGAVSPKIYFAKGFEFHKNRYKKDELGKVIWYAGGNIDWDNVYGKSRGVDEVDRGQYNKGGETDFATGACMFLTAKALRDIGVFDEKYYLYYEDTDLSQRMKNKGWKVWYEPKAIIWHKVAQSSGIGSDLNDYFTTRNRMLFGMRYAPLRTKLALAKESVKLLLNGRKWQKIGVKDFYLGKFGKGSWK